MLGDAGEPFASTIRDSKPGRGDTRRYGLSAQQVAEKSKEVRKTRFEALRARAAEIAPQVKERTAELVEEFRAANNRKPDAEERKALRKQASAEIRAEQEARKPGRHDKHPKTVAATQRALNKVMHAHIDDDGVFGPDTDGLFRTFQWRKLGRRQPGAKTGDGTPTVYEFSMLGKASGQFTGK